ncbi:PLAP5 [Auxenochlorella protothecoides x Auxenochlorella symbiontica]
MASVRLRSCIPSGQNSPFVKHNVVTPRCMRSHGATLCLPRPLAFFNRWGNNPSATIKELSALQQALKEDPLPASSTILNLVDALESSNTGIKDPTRSPLIEGRWRLLYNTKESTASPVQRAATGTKGLSIFQDILLGDASALPRVVNVVEFGSLGKLEVEAQASTTDRPLEGFIPRSGAGLPFGILGVSSTQPPDKPHTRIDFQFSRAAFKSSKIPFQVPYPVPFRLLGDERKGWIDTTYLARDGRLRIARGNKGTVFILAKDDPPAS